MKRLAAALAILTTTTLAQARGSQPPTEPSPRCMVTYRPARFAPAGWGEITVTDGSRRAGAWRLVSPQMTGWQLDEAGLAVKAGFWTVELRDGYQQDVNVPDDREALVDCR